MALARSSLLVVGLSGLVGCAYHSPALIRTEEYQRDIEQVGVAPSPTGSHAIGPLPQKGRLAFDTELSTAAVPSPARSRLVGAPGTYAASEWARVRIATGLNDNVELGLELEGSPLNLSHPLATDLGIATVSGVIGRVGPWIRGRARSQHGEYIEAQLQGSGTLLPYDHIETETLTITDYDYGIVRNTYGHTDTLERQAALFFWGWRAGMAFGHETRDGWDLSLGASLEGLPSFYGFNHASWGCEYYSDSTSVCTEAPRRPADTRLVLAWTGTMALAIPVGQTPFTLLTSISTHRGSDLTPAHELAEVPISGTLGLRVTPRAGAEVQPKPRVPSVKRPTTAQPGVGQPR